MTDIELHIKTDKDVQLTKDLMNKYWGGEPLIVRTKNFYPTKLEGLFAEKESKIVGFLFYDIQGSNCEIIVFEALEKFKGIGTVLLNKLKDIAKEKSCTRIFLMTNNDNMDALRFYQRRGFHICAIHLDSVKESRKVKPEIPMTGDYGIPLRDEIDLEYLF